MENITGTFDSMSVNERPKLTNDDILKIKLFSNTADFMNEVILKIMVNGTGTKDKSDNNTDMAVNLVLYERRSAANLQSCIEGQPIVNCTSMPAILVIDDPILRKLADKSLRQRMRKKIGNLFTDDSKKATNVKKDVKEDVKKTVAAEEIAIYDSVTYTLCANGRLPKPLVHKVSAYLKEGFEYYIIKTLNEPDNFTFWTSLTPDEQQKEFRDLATEKLNVDAFEKFMPPMDKAAKDASVKLAIKFVCDNVVSHFAKK